MADHQREMELLLGVLEALPCPAALLDRTGDSAYVNSRYCPVSLDDLDFASLSGVREALRGQPQSSDRVTIEVEQSKVSGIMEVYPVRSEQGSIVGALWMFHPEFTQSELTADALPSESTAMEMVFERLQRLRLLNSAVLFLGEDGVGKQDFAQALHRMTSHRDKPFVALDKDTTMSKLYKAVLEANEGTLFLSRVDLWSDEMQSELLQIMVTKQISIELGHFVPVLARIMASGSPDLPRMAEQGAFSAELYKKLNVLPAYIPALRERAEDILPAARQVLRYFAQQDNKDVQDFTKDAKEIMVSYGWPGNIPEMKRVVEEAVRDCPGGLILASHLAIGRPKTEGGSLYKMREAYTREHIQAMLDVYGNTVEGKKAAARELGIGLSTLYRILAKRVK